MKKILFAFIGAFIALGLVGCKHNGHVYLPVETSTSSHETNIIYGLNISFHSCFNIEGNKLHIHQFSVDGSNFFPLTLSK